MAPAEVYYTAHSDSGNFLRLYADVPQGLPAIRAAVQGLSHRQWWPSALSVSRCFGCGPCWPRDCRGLASRRG
jgi:hypothetical protein